MTHVMREREKVRENVTNIPLGIYYLLGHKGSVALWIGRFTIISNIGAQIIKKILYEIDFRNTPKAHLQHNKKAFNFF